VLGNECGITHDRRRVSLAVSLDPLQSPWEAKAGTICRSRSIVASVKVLRLDWSIGRLIADAGAGEPGCAARCAALT